ncbi:MAG: RHS repeat-associated core domain-containing protein, partial [Myxococcales bacterium]|nr:RHS repeat-associated core domain-containing protein [Myxococcales bacterium]
FRNRWYSVEAGQWLTHDPLGEVDSVNLYAFNRFDSVNFVDPFGLKTNSAAAGETIVICHEADGYTCGPKGRAAREKDLLKVSQDAERHSQEPARAVATALLGVASATSGGIGSGAVSRVPKNGVAIAVAAGVGLGVIACQAGVDAQCQSNLKGIEEEAGRLAEELRKETIREIAAVVGIVIAAVAEGEDGETEQPSPAPASPDESKSESKGPPLTEYWDLDEAGNRAFGEGTEVLGETDEKLQPKNADVTNQEIRDKIEALGYNPDEFKSRYYDVIKPDKTYDRMNVFEAGNRDGKVYVAPHSSNGIWK